MSWRVAYVVPRQVFERKMSRVRFQQMEALDDQLQAQRHHPLHWTGPGWPGWDDGRPASENLAAWWAGCLAQERLPHLLRGAAVVYKVDGLAASPVPLVVQYNEAYDVGAVDTYVRENRVGAVVFHHANDVRRYEHWPPERRRVHVPHCADERVYRDYGLEKDVDVLVAGNRNQHYYPFRYRLGQLAHRVLRKRGYRVQVLEHPGYELPPRDGTVVGEAFARLMNRSRLVFTCSMRYNYALAKYSEIALCRALAVADLPAERKDFFGETVLRVEPWMLDEEILWTVERVLDDPAELRRRTDRAWELTRAQSTMPRYAELFYHHVLVPLLAVDGAPRAAAAG